MDRTIELPTGSNEPSLAERRRRRRARRRVVLGLVAIALVGATIGLRRPLFGGNLGVVDEGLVYRSAQPVGDVLGQIRERGIASILNLRGGGEDDPWYVAEVEATRLAGVDFYDLPMSAVRRPSRRELLSLLEVLGRCRYPLLIHCKSGADRTGLATGLYLMSRKGVPPEEAEGAFTLTHAHVALFGPERLHEPFDEYAAWLAEAGLAHTPDRLLDWVRHNYASADSFAPLDPVKVGPRVRRREARTASAAR